MQEPETPHIESRPIAALELQHLPPFVVVAIYDCLAEAGEVVRAGTVCKTIWNIVAAAQFTKVNSLRFKCFHPELQHRIPHLAQQFPTTQTLNLTDCSALPEPWLQQAAEVWRLRDLNVTRMWHWNGSVCLPYWASSLTRLVANDTSFPIVEALRQPASAAVKPTSTDSISAGTGTANSAAVAVGRSKAGQQDKQLGQTMAWVSQLRDLRELHLSGLVRDPVRCREHGSRDCNCEEDTLLSAILFNNSNLTHLNLSSNPQLPDRLLHWALTSNAVGLRTLDLSGCNLIRPGYVGSCCFDLQHLDISGTAATDADVIMIASQIAGLTYLSLKECRQVSDIGLTCLSSSHCVTNSHLQYLNLGGLTRTHSAALVQLLIARRAPALSDCGCVHEADNLNSAAHRTTVPTSTGTADFLHLGLSYTAGASDAVLGALASASAVAAATTKDVQSCDDAGILGLMRSLTVGDHTRQHNTPSATAMAGKATETTKTGRQGPFCCTSPSVGLSGLELGGCNSVSGLMLLHIASVGLLQCLRDLDVSDMEDLRSPHTLNPVTGTGAAAAAGAAISNTTQGRCSEAPNCPATHASAGAAGATISAPDSILGQVFAFTGSQMTSLTLDGCYVDTLTAGFISQQCRVLEHLSVVGCRGLGTDGLSALVSSGRCGRGLRSLFVGGSSCLWKEREALSSLVSLTELRVFRRSAVTDVDLAPVLAANQRLQKLTLVGCYSLTDQLFVLATMRGNKIVSNMASLVSAQRDLHCAIGAAVEGDCNSHGYDALGGLGLLTQLKLTACDGMLGSSISRLRNLRSLRISFCPSLDKAAIQHLLVACKKLVLVELPAQLQGHVYSHTSPFVAVVANRRGGGQVGRGASARHTKSTDLDEPIAIGTNTVLSQTPVLLPKQGLGGHLHGLKVVCV